LGTVITDNCGELYCTACEGTDIKKTTMTYASKLLFQELTSMGIDPQLVTRKK